MKQDAVEQRLAAEFFGEQLMAGGDDGGDGGENTSDNSGITSKSTNESAPASTLSWSTSSEPSDYRPRFNVSLTTIRHSSFFPLLTISQVAPQSHCLVITRNDAPTAKTPYTMQAMKWGLVPSYMKEPPTKPLSTINARDDKVASGEGMWRNLRSTHRCVIVTEGFYEWIVKGKDRLPYFVKLPNQLMIMAGLHDTASYVVLSSFSWSWSWSSSSLRVVVDYSSNSLLFAVC